MGHRDRVPRFPGPLAQSLLVQVPCHLQGGAILPVHLIYHAYHGGLSLVDAELLQLFVVPIPEGDPAAVPKPLFGPGQHYGGDTLGGHVPLQLSKDQDDFQHGLAYGRRGVKLLVLGHEGHAVVLELLVHGGKVQQVPAYAVYLPYQDVGKLPGADPRHHPLVGWPVGVLGAVPGVLEDLVIPDAQHQLCVLRQLIPLEWKAVPVYLPFGGHPDVDCHLLLVHDVDDALFRFAHIHLHGCGMSTGHHAGP